MDTTEAIAAPLLAWAAERGRTLAVREARTPWAVLVAEVMSQQTQIARVGPYWRRFLDRWPTPDALATASTRELLDAWAGLGYNRRPLALRDAARRIVTEHGGRVPADVAALEALPGIGRYTARAVAANAFGLPVAPVDVNVRRVVTRVTGIEGAGVQAEADRLIAATEPGPWVHATMDLAATVCTRLRPRCEDCPLADICRSRGTGGEPPRRRSTTTATVAGDAADRAGRPFPATTRWLRGRILARLREVPDGVWTTFDGPIGSHDVAAVRQALRDLADERFVELDEGRARLLP
ncbi:MAG TPA: A/G-specific adenine glycosylase [Candidatus Binatia bacterium]|nr:A/G-specific adenine glycosylase [Candidatus Binatia bacterium]